MSVRLTRHVAWLGLAAVLAACSPGQPGPTAPAASTGLGASTGAAPSGGPVAAQPQDLGAAEIALRATDRTRAGLVNLGAGAADLAGQMDERAGRALQGQLTRTQAVIAGQTADAPAADLVSDTTPGGAIYAPWAGTMLIYDALMGNGPGNTRITDDQDSLPGCVPGFGTCSDTTPPVPPSEDSGSASDTTGPTDESVTVGGHQGTITMTTTATVAFDGSKVSIDLEIKVRGEVRDATGATIYRIESTGTGHIDGDACPDASGVAAAHVAFSATESYLSGGGTYGIDKEFSGDVRIRADDDANLAGVEVMAKAHETSRGGVVAGGGGESELLAHELSASATLTLANDATAGFGAPVLSNQAADSVEATNLILGMGLFTQVPAKVAAKAAEKAWRSGMCVRVSPSPKGGDVAKDSTTTVDVIVRQRYENEELHKPVQATLDSGPKSIDPAGQPQPAPATFTYTAGSKDGEVGLVTFKSTSNRGIGRTGVFFKVGGGWSAARQQGESKITGQKCGGLDGLWTLVAAIKNGQIDSKQTWLATINGTTLMGTYTYRAVTSSFPGFVTTTTGKGRAAIVAQPDATLKMTIFGTTVTSTAVGAGGSETLHLALPDQSFIWTAGGTCP